MGAGADDSIVTSLYYMSREFAKSVQTQLVNTRDRVC